MTAALVIAGSVVAFLLVVVLLIRRVASRADAVLEDTVRDRRALRVDTVRTLGLESLGPTQVRGTGKLALLEDELVFVQWAPRRVTRIPLGAIAEIETPRAFLGKTAGVRLLAVSWRTAEGAQERAAWEVGDLGGWQAALSSARPSG
jgi:hypothetical protein